MTTEHTDNVVSLAQRAQERLAREHEPAKFAFRVVDDDEIEDMLGETDHKGRRAVVVVTEPSSNKGLLLTPDQARVVALALISVAHGIDLREEHGWIAPGEVEAP